MKYYNETNTIYSKNSFNSWVADRSMWDFKDYLGVYYLRFLNITFDSN